MEKMKTYLVSSGFQNIAFRLNWIIRVFFVGPEITYSGIMKADRFFAKAFPKPKATGMV